MRSTFHIYRARLRHWMKLRLGASRAIGRCDVRTVKIMSLHRRETVNMATPVWWQAPRFVAILLSKEVLVLILFSMFLIEMTLPVFIYYHRHSNRPQPHGMIPPNRRKNFLLTSVGYVGPRSYIVTHRFSATESIASRQPIGPIEFFNVYWH